MSAATTFGALAPGARFRLTPAGEVWGKVNGRARDRFETPYDAVTGYALADDRKVYPVSDAEYLEHLRGEIQAERISWGELADLQDMAELIDPGDVELLEWAGVPEHPEPRAWEITVVLHAEGETPADALAAWIADNGAENLPIQSATEEDA